tara:strand:- start:1594 stop:1773 length:180 start_codon:yes stop_codon:yes gene_type:complete
MSKTTEYLIPPTMQLTPQHVDAMHLVKLFVKEYEDRNLDTQSRVIATDNFYQTCKNFGF